MAKDLPHILRVALAVEDDISFDPGNIGMLCAD